VTHSKNRKIEFWYEFASTYSYLSVMRIEALANEAGAEIVWRPFLLGPIFRAQGWRDSPFNLYPAKGRYMIRDMQRITISRGLPFEMPQQFPANGLLAARIALIGAAQGWVAPFTKAVFSAQFGRGESISDETVIGSILVRLGQEDAKLIEQSKTSTIKEQLRNQTERAAKIGVFGAPSFVTKDDELFWGDDRLVDALSWPVTL